MPAVDNIGLVRQFVESTNRRDWSGMEELITADFEWHTAISDYTVSRVIKGLPAFRDWWETEVAESFDLDASHEEIEEVFDLGDAVVAVIRSVDVGKASGATIESRTGCLWDVADGRLTRLRVFVEPADALRSVGLDPQD